VTVATKRRWTADELQEARALALQHLQTTASVAPEPLSIIAAGEDEPELDFGPLFRAAAVCSRFRIETLTTPGSDSKEIARLEAASIALRERTGTGWRTLPPIVRIDVLRQMTRAELEQNLAALSDADDPLQRALRLALDGVRGDDLLRSSSGELAALVQVYDGLAAQTTLPPRTEFERKLELVRLLEPMRRITATFNGREAELQRLRDYVGVLPPSSLLGKIKRAITAPFEAERKPPYLIYGPGGVGKTTLVARFILEHALIETKMQFPFAYLDFDRPTVSGARATTILIEAVRQIGLQYDAAHAASEQFRARWEQSLRSAIASSDDFVDPDLLRNFAFFLDTLEVRTGPVLFVLDTFEEVQARSLEYAKGVLALMAQLASSVPRLRVVVAGRSEIGNIELIYKEQLDQFDELSAVAYLVAHEVPQDAASDIYKKVGGSPLALSLALQIYRRDPKELRDQSGFRIDSSELQDEVVQAQLFDRILLHIDDDDVRKLAHPGLVLRRVTPEIIELVLAGPCEIVVRDRAHAEELFDKLAKDATLVSIPNPSERVLIHRADVRRLMLRPLRRDARDKVEEIHRLAVQYYSGRTELDMRVEEVYHRLALGDSREVIEPLVSPEMEPRLVGALDELEPPEQALLADLFHLELSDDARHAADQLAWERATSRRLKDSVRAGTSDIQTALEILSERQARTGATDLLIAEVELWWQVRDQWQAKSVAERAIATYRDSGNVEYLLRATLLAAQLEQNLADPQAAYARLTEAEEIARRSGEPMALARVLRHRCAYLHIEEEPVPQELRDELASMVSRVSDAAWARDLPLLRGVAEEIGREEPSIVSRALRLGALAVSSSGMEYIRRMLRTSGTKSDVLADLVVDATAAGVVLDVLKSEDTRKEQRGTGTGGTTKRDDASSTIRLSVAQRTKLRDILTKYYGARLSTFAFSRLGIGLEAVSFGSASPSDDLPKTALDLVRFAERTETMLPELIVGVWRAQYENPEVLAFIDEIGLGPTLRGTRSLPEAELRKIVTDYRGSIGALEARTCSVWRRKQPVGCGFLEQPAAVMTLGYVAGPDPDDLQFWFSMVRMKGRFLNEGQSARPHRRSTFSNDNDWATRVLIELDRPIGRAPIEEALAESGTKPRGSVMLVERNPVIPEPILWLWRDNGVTFISGIKLKDMAHLETRRIATDTIALAAGAPCFDMNLNVIGIHDGAAIRLF
jgi:AAA ATPase-like protein